MTRNMIFLHGLESSSQTYKAGVIRNSFLELIVPDFTGPLEARMKALYPILGDKKDWTIIGSSFGGLMGAIFTCEHPEQVRKQVLLAPALMLPEFASFLDASTSLSTSLGPVTVPTTIIHGRQDTVVPLEEVREIAEKVFSNLTYHIVDDDHRLHKATDTLDWKAILA
ncbi:MAG: alpha/beta hydrolase [Anaerolineales bacterium]|nr:alpha/beta hydrolase [Anaerolineales bacterium]